MGPQPLVGRHHETRSPVLQLPAVVWLLNNRCRSRRCRSRRCRSRRCCRCHRLLRRAWHGTARPGRRGAECFNDGQMSALGWLQARRNLNGAVVASVDARLTQREHPPGYGYRVILSAYETVGPRTVRRGSPHHSVRSLSSTCFIDTFTPSRNYVSGKYVSLTSARVFSRARPDVSGSDHIMYGRVGVVHVHAKAYANPLPASLIRKNASKLARNRSGGRTWAILGQP